MSDATITYIVLGAAVVVAVLWTAFFVLWYLIGIPLGPGWPV